MYNGHTQYWFSFKVGFGYIYIYIQTHTHTSKYLHIPAIYRKINIILSLFIFNNPGFLRCNFKNIWLSLNQFNSCQSGKGTTVYVPYASRPWILEILNIGKKTLEISFVSKANGDPPHHLIPSPMEMMNYIIFSRHEKARL